MGKIIQKLNTYINHKDFTLVIAFIIASIIFFVLINQLGGYESGLHCDEAGIGINSYFLSENFHDENNVFLPLFIENFVGYKMPVYVYLTSIIVKFIGLSVFSIRLLAAICGAYTVLFLFLLARRYFGNFTAISSILFLGLSPGFFHIQRIAFELTTFSCFFLGSLYFLTLRIDKKSNYYLIPAFVFFILAWYSYIPTQIFMLSTVGLMLLFNIKSIKKLNKDFFSTNKKVIIASLAAFVVFIIVPNLIILPKLMGTFHVASKFLLANLNNIERINVSLNIINNLYPALYSVIIKLPTIIQLGFIGLFHWLQSYSVNFLFWKGDLEPRHIVPHFGPLPLLFLFLIPPGLIVCINNFKQQEYKIVLAMFLSIGMPSAFVITDLELTHNSHMYPIMAVLAAIGFAFVIKQFIKPIPVKVIACILALIFVFMPFLKYQEAYFTSYRKDYDKSWYAHRYQIVSYIRNNYKKYDKVYFSGQIHEIYAYILFYGIQLGDLNIKNYQLNKEFPYNSYGLKKDLYSASIKEENIRNTYGKNLLFVLNPEELKNINSIEVIKYNNGTPLAVFKEIK